MRFAYADPPYPGCATRFYSHDPRCAEVSYPDLIARLVAEYPDGWALSMNSVNLKDVLPYAPKKSRILAWVKSYAVMRPNVWPTYAWEPVLFFGGRKGNRVNQTPFDWHLSAARQDVRMAGCKPTQFAFWLFSCWNAQRDDEVVDLFPGAGAFLSAWEFYRRAMTPEPECKT